MKNRIRRYTRAYEVSIGNKSTVVHTEDRAGALERAVTKLYGSDCFWFADSGLPGYGQVFRALRATKYNSNPGNSSVTYRVGIDIEPIGKPSRNFLKQQQEDREENERINAELKMQYERERRAHHAGMDGEPFPEFTDGVDMEWLKQQYRDGIRHRADWEDEQRTQQQAAEDNERREQEQQEREYMTAVHTEAIEENQRHDEHKKRVASEVDRLRSIPLDIPITDPILSAIARDVAVHSWAENGRIGIMGDFKRAVVNGEHPDLVREFLESPMIYGRLDNVVE